MNGHFLHCSPLRGFLPKLFGERQAYTAKPCWAMRQNGGGQMPRANLEVQGRPGPCKRIGLGIFKIFDDSRQVLRLGRQLGNSPVGFAHGLRCFSRNGVDVFHRAGDLL